ncbi:hypothetical protein [Desulfovibrio gilichinskyi]|uniref:Uncharacterized protein n=1 Tax=Desulfovibrio gilichinskyi TaxID=1519643 RepID=A0A1X7CCT3_9BACT|nr:hypothetical protein [Desulfovibrio gilichinskyi]SME94335.1 hypothetical protein SAMN06295933_0692 [Desulfovibrio gilichinskyi]
MRKKSIHATNFRKVLELFRDDRSEEAIHLLKIIQEDYLELYSENKELRSQIKEVANILDLAECMDFDGQKYWIKEDSDITGPYCQVCYDKEGTLIRLQEREKHWECYCCKNLFAKIPKGITEEKEAPATKFKPPLKLFSSK